MGCGEKNQRQKPLLSLLAALSVCVCTPLFAPVVTPSRPKTPGSASQGSGTAAPLSASTTAQVAVVWETPRRKSTDGMSTPLQRRSSCTSSSSKSSGSVSRVTSAGKTVVGGDDSNDGLHTPALRGGSCAICLSPLKKKSGGNDREVYTVQLCRVSELDSRCGAVSC